MAEEKRIRVAHVGDKNLIFRVKVVEVVTEGEDPVGRDISDALTQAIKLARPDGTITSYGAGFPSGEDGTEFNTEYATASSSILPAGSDGWWRIQAAITFNDGTEFNTEWEDFLVKPVLTP